MKNSAWKNVLSAVLFAIIAMVSAAALSCVWSGEQPVSAAESDLSLVSITGNNVSGSSPGNYKVWLRDGDTTKVKIQLHNASGHKIEFMRAVKINGEVIDDNADYSPIVFAPSTASKPAVVTDATPRKEDQVTGKTGTRYAGYDIEAGADPTFELELNAGDTAPGTHQWTIQFGKERWDYAQEKVDINGLSFDEWIYQGAEIVDYYSGSITISVEVYTQNARLKVGENKGTDFGSSIEPFEGGKIDFGTVDLADAFNDNLTGSRTVTVYNDSAPDVTTDNHGNTTSIKVGFDGENTRNGQKIEGGGAFTWGNHKLYDENWVPLEAPKTEGNSITYSQAWYSVDYDATDLIAGKYTGNLIINTVPHRVTINGQTTITDGVYKIPFEVTLTGTNPRLLPRATNLRASSQNGYVELTWKTPDNAGEYTEYYIYRREGTETETDPDKLDWSQYENVGSKVRGTDDNLLYIDADVENGKTYSYTVMAGDPYHGYAAKTVTATPSSSYNSPMLAPDATAHGDVDGIQVSWAMNERYGGNSNDGSGMVEYFNVYRDGVLVDRIYRSAVDDKIERGWIDEPDGTSHYGIKSHSYSWSVLEPVPEPYQQYTFSVSAVSPSGVESHLCTTEPAEATTREPTIRSHQAWFDPYYDVEWNDDDSWTDIRAILIYGEEYCDGDVIDTLDIWRAEGTTAPDTSQKPYASCDKYTGYSSYMYDYADTNIAPNKTYTYSIRGNYGEGKKTNIYTFTVKTVEEVEFGSAKNLKCSVSNDGSKVRLTWYGDSYYDDDEEDYRYTGVYRVYRNNVLIGTYQNEEDYDIYDDPGSDGTYTYRVDKTVSGVTVRGRDLTFVRNTLPPEEIALLQVPDAPTLTGKTSGKRNVVLNWKPAATGGAPEGYHIYRKDGETVQTGGRYLTEYQGDGSAVNYYQSWGNDRYITLQRADELTFVDGPVNSKPNNGYYKNDIHLGEIISLDWDDDDMPHEYYITAYNRAGESAPSEIVTFDTYTTDEAGNHWAPDNPAEESPAAPTLNNLWIEWEDGSSFRYGFDDTVYGSARVAWEDSGLGSDIDSWTVTYGCDDWKYDTTRTESVDAYQAITDPTIKLGTSEDSPNTRINGYVGEDGDVGHTITATVTAKNSAGEAVSNEQSVKVNSIPRFYCLPGNGGALLRWTDMEADDGSTITGWQVWRKDAYGSWQCVATEDKLPQPGIYAGQSETYYHNIVNYYEWIDDTVENGWTYEYKVVAECNDNVDRPSVVREVTPQRTAAVVEPGDPQNLKVKVVNGDVMLNWDPPATGSTVNTYRVQMDGPDTEMYYYSDTYVSGDSTSAVWRPEKPGTYRLLVWAESEIEGKNLPVTKNPYEIENYDNLSDEEKINAIFPNHSNVVTVTITEADIKKQNTDRPDAPELTVSTEDGKVTLSWAACTGAAYYTVERSRADGQYDSRPVDTLTAGQQDYTFIDEDVDPGVRYMYRVFAYNGGGKGDSTAVYITAIGKTRDEQVADRVAALIDTLPEPDEVLARLEGDDPEVAAATEAAVQEVAGVWNALTDNQKAYVDENHTQKIMDCQEIVVTQALRKEYADVINEAQTAINALPSADEVRLDHETDIENARNKYESIDNPIAKNLVRISKLTAAEAALRDLKYNLKNATVTVTGSIVIGADEEPAVSVSMNGQTLTKGKDFIIQGYRSEGSEYTVPTVQNYGVYTVQIKGIGQYFGQTDSTDTFTAYEAADDLDNSIANTTAFEYNGAMIDPALELVLNGQPLEKDTDYQFDSFYTVEGGTRTPIEASQVKDVGSYEVKVTEKGGRYFGYKMIAFTVTPLSIQSERVTVEPIADQKYSFQDDGRVEPLPVVKLGDTVLIKDKDYTVSYANNRTVGEAQVIISGKGNFENKRIATFRIVEEVIDESSAAAYSALLNDLALTATAAKTAWEQAVEGTQDKADKYNTYLAALANLNAAGDLEDADTVEILIRNFTYTGDAIRPSGNALIVRKTYNGVKYDLKQDDHYSLSVSDNTNATEQAQLIISGTGSGADEIQAATHGSVNRTFKILPADISGAVITAANETYNGLAHTPRLQVTCNNRTLTTAVDYVDASYTDNIEAGEAAVSITGTGNYQGTGHGSFVIDPAELTATYAGEEISIGEVPSLKVTVTGFVNGETAQSLGDDYQTPVVETAEQYVGTYELFPAGGYAKNYTFKYQSGTLVVRGRALTEATMTGLVNYTYDGTAKTQDPVVKLVVKGREIILRNGIDYVLDYTNNVNAGTAAVTATGIGGYSQSITGYFKINQAKVTPTVILSAADFTYTGAVMTPAVTVMNGGTRMNASQYNVIYPAGRKTVGQYAVTVSLKGNYTGARTVYFRINPKGTKLSKLTKKKKALAVKWKKQTADMGNGKISGYQIQCSRKKDFVSGVKTVNVSGAKKKSRTIKKLKAKKTYYVRIRTYKTVGGMTFYSPWSAAKKKKTK